MAATLPDSVIAASLAEMTRCPGCRGPMEVWKRYNNGSWHRLAFCSQSCANRSNASNATTAQRETKSTGCRGCGRPIKAWAKSGKTWRRRTHCSKSCAATALWKRQSTQIANKKASETTTCKNCGCIMPVWRKNKPPLRGWSRRGDFCSTSCAKMFQWSDINYRLAMIPVLKTILKEKAQPKASEWHRSEAGREQKSKVRKGRNLRRMIRPDEQTAAASLASMMIGAIASSVTGGPIDPPEISIKVDGRILNSGTRNHNTQKTVRLTDGKIFDTASEAAADSSGSPTGVSVAVNTGSVHKGHQFMRYEEWITAGKPNAHPLSHERKPVSVAETARRAARLTAWHKSEEGRAFHRAQMTGPKNPACRRVVRLSDGKVFEVHAPSCN